MNLNNVPTLGLEITTKMMGKQLMVAKQLVPDLEKDWFHRLLSVQPKVDLKELAKSVGVSMESIRKWLNGGGVSRDNLAKLLKYFDTDFDALNDRASFPSQLENKWHQLPTKMQNHLMAQIDAQLKFQQQNPLLTSSMFPELAARNKLCAMPNLPDRVANSTMTMIMIVDLEGTIHYANDAVKRALSGKSHRELVGSHKRDWWPLDWERCTEIDRDICAEGEPRDYLFTMHVTEDETVHTYMRTVPLMNSEGEYSHVIKYVFDLEQPLKMLKEADPVFVPI
ncbi:MAG: PAS domain-containing protein [Pseudomonadota bacterium]